MKAGELRAMIDERPFRPLRLHMSEGDPVDITRPRGVLVAQRMVVVALDMDERGIAGRTTWFDPRHVVKVERVEQPESENGRRESE